MFRASLGYVVKSSLRKTKTDRKKRKTTYSFLHSYILIYTYIHTHLYMHTPTHIYTHTHKPTTPHIDNHTQP